jgi:hypothetical protein
MKRVRKGRARCPAFSVYLSLFHFGIKIFATGLVSLVSPRFGAAFAQY